MESVNENKVETGHQNVSIQEFMKKMEQMEKRMDEISKQQKQLQDAFYRMYEEQRRKERTL